MSGYVDTVYDEKIRPRTDYPEKLCVYLAVRFQLSPGARILDAGCGRGDFLDGFAKNGFEVYGLDKESGSAKNTSSSVVKDCDLEKDSFPFSDDFFDAVFAKSVIEHLFDPQNFVTECRRVLKPRGRIILMTPDWKSTMSFFFDDHTHRHPYTVQAAKDILDIFGFREAKAELFYQLPVLWKYPSLKIISRILRFFVTPNPRISNKFIRWSVELMILATAVK